MTSAPGNQSVNLARLCRVRPRTVASANLAGMTAVAPDVKRIAMWSGPRNLSTALMRSFGNRPDTLVVDEPFYAHYLAATGLSHPGRQEILDHHESDWRAVAASLHAAPPAGIRVHYQKHMAHHLLPEMGREWLTGLKHAFLLRDPADMLRSLGAKLETVRLEDTGLPQQLELFERLWLQDNEPPPVIDADDLLANPPVMLEALCGALEISFDPSMLQWPAGKRLTDGIWAKHWYESVEASTRFQRWARSAAPLSGPLAALERTARPIYDAMYRHRLRF